MLLVRNARQIFILSLSALVVVPAANASVVTGNISAWNESSTLRPVGDGAHHVTMWWSINSLQPDRGWFYGSFHTGDSDVAWATGVTAIDQITDASSLSFTNFFITAGTEAGLGHGNNEGDFLVFRNKNTHHYGVLRVDNIYKVNHDLPNIDYNTALNATWWFQTDGSANFAAVPEPASLAGLGIASSMLLRLRRRKQSS